MENQGSIVVGIRKEGRQCLIEVSDTGKGIPSGRWETIFVPGYTTKSRGWGLGLSLAKRIVEEYHRGRIYVKSSDPASGTVFRIELNA
jgi:signal transduction histidine kinase